MFCSIRHREDKYHLTMKCSLENERKLLKLNAFIRYPHAQLYDESTLYKRFMANLDENIFVHLNKFIYICFIYISDQNLLLHYSKAQMIHDICIM